MGDANDAVMQAQQLFDAGQAKYETHDYLGAIEAFTDAYLRAAEIPDPTRRDFALARLRYNLARAHVFAYDIDANAEHLGLAHRLIADYRANERAIGSDPDTDTDVKQLEDDLAQRERALQRAAAQANEPSPTIDNQPVEREASPHGGRRPSTGGFHGREDNPARGRTQRRAGVAMLALAVPFAGLAVAGGVMGAQADDAFTSVTTQDARTAARQRGRVGNVLFGVGVGLAVVSAASGAIAFGVSMRTKRTDLSLHATPTGLVFSGEF
jgi:hypothetical protein